jgi:hypothetical protein
MKQTDWADICALIVICATFIAFCHCIRSCDVEQVRLRYSLPATNINTAIP